MNKTLPFLFLFSLLLTGCAREPQAVTQQFFAMDTSMSITAYGADAAGAITAAQQEVFRLDALWSRTRPESDVSRLNDRAGDGAAVAVAPDTALLLMDANAAALESALAFDPVLAPVMDAWGFGSADTETKAVHRVPAPQELRALLPLTRDLPTASLSGDGASASASLPLPGQALDLGAIAKGAAAGHVMESLAENGVDSALISLGGNISAVGMRPGGTPFRVAVKDPRQAGSYLCVFSLAPGKTCSTSGGYERFFEENGRTYHHIIDPATGYPAESGLLSATVVSENGAWADAWSTALFVQGPEQALEFWRSGEGAAGLLDLVLVAGDGHVYVTEGLEEDFDFQGEEAGYRYEIVRR